MAGPYSFGEFSRKQLDTCDDRLIQIAEEAIKRVNFSVLEGARPRGDQEKYFNTGKSKVQWPDSKHNIITAEEAVLLGIEPRLKSLAFDLAPYPIDWSPEKVSRFFYLAGVIQTVASVLKIPIRWGHDFDRDQDFYNQKFLDAPHFEIDDEGSGGMYIP